MEPEYQNNVCSHRWIFPSWYFPKPTYDHCWVQELIGSCLEFIFFLALTKVLEDLDETVVQSLDIFIAHSFTYSCSSYVARYYVWRTVAEWKLGSIFFFQFSLSSKLGNTRISTDTHRVIRTLHYQTKDLHLNIKPLNWGTLEHI